MLGKVYALPLWDTSYWHGGGVVAEGGGGGEGEGEREKGSLRWLIVLNCGSPKCMNCRLLGGATIYVASWCE